MDQQLEDKIRSKWVRIKATLCGSSTQLADLLYQNGIIEFDDYDRVRGLQTAVDQVDVMLRRVMQRKECAKFLEILLELGYSSLCEEIEGSGSCIQTTAKDTRSKTDFNEDKAVIDEMKQLFLAREKQNKEENRRHLEQINESFNDAVVKMNDCQINNFKKLENDLASLKDSHQFAYNELYRLTKLELEKQSENVILGCKRENTLEKIKKLEGQLKVSRSKINEENVQHEQEKLKELEIKLKHQTKQMERITNEKNKQHDLFESKDREYKRLMTRFEELKKENNKFRQKSDQKYSSNSKPILDKMGNVVGYY